MPANLTPDFKAAEERYHKADSLDEKVAALEEMLAKVPKHKGTEKIQADIKSKLAKARKQAETKSGGPARHRETYSIPREGAGRAVLVGMPNTGKSRLFNALTGAGADVQDYAFTTRAPQPGMMPFEDIAVQLIDLPAVSRQFMESWVPQLVRLADVALLVVDVASLDPARQAAEPVEVLLEKKVRLVPPGGAVDPAEADPSCSVVAVRTLLVANCMDVDGAAEILELLRGDLPAGFPLLGASAADGTGIDGMRRAVVDALDVTRVYSKQPGKKAETAPFVVKRGTTTIEFAAKVHRDFAERFQFARVWRRGSEVEGLRVAKDFVLLDGDVVELHI